MNYEIDPAETYKRPLTAVSHDVIRACAILSCDFEVKGIDDFPEKLPLKQGTAFLVAPELIATCAHLLDILTNRVDAYTVANSRSPSQATAGTQNTINLALLDWQKNPEDTSQIVRCMPGEKFDAESKVYKLTRVTLIPIYVSSGYLDHLNRHTTRTITLMFPELSKRTLTVVIPPENYKDDLYAQWAIVNNSMEIDNATYQTAEAADEFADRIQDLPLCPEVHCAYEHDCAVIQLAEDQAIWDTIPVQLGGGISIEETIYLFGYPEAARGSALSLRGRVLREIVAKYRCPSTSHRISCEFPAAGESSDPHGFSGGPVIAEDGTCIGIQSSLIPVNAEEGQPGTQHRTLYASPTFYLQRLLPFRLALKYRLRIYAHALRALQAKRRNHFVDPIILVHRGYEFIGRTLTNVLKAYQFLGASQIRTDLLIQCNQALEELGKARNNDKEKAKAKIFQLMDRASLIIICICQDESMQLNKDFIDLIEPAASYALENDAVLVSCAITDRNMTNATIEMSAIDVSETFPVFSVSKNNEDKQLVLLTSIVHRIHLLFESAEDLF